MRDTMARKFNERSIEALLEENQLLGNEVEVAHKASEITADLVVEQFVKMEEVLRRLEENVATEQKLRESLALQNKYLGALHETTLGLISRLDLNDLLQALITRTVELLKASGGIIYLAAPGSKGFGDVGKLNHGFKPVSKWPRLLSGRPAPPARRPQAG